MPTGFVIGDRGLGTSGDTHPHWMMAHAIVGPYLVAGASAVGQIHQARGVPRDDAFTVRSVGPWLAAVVADGVGSRPNSRYGASYTADALTAYLLNPLPKPTEDIGQGEPATKRSGILIPPAQIGEPKFDPSIPQRPAHGAGQGFLFTRLIDWSRKSRSSEGKQAAQPEGFLQAGSTGWWAIPGIPDPKANPTPTSGPSQVPGSPHSNSSGRPLSPTPRDTPNLTAIVRQAFEKTHLGLRAQAQNLGLELTDLGCTALALLLNLETGWGAVGQVGDGAVLGMTAHGEVMELTHAPDTGDPQSTYTLTRPHFENYLAVGSVERPPVDPLVAFFLMTDGLSGDLLYAPGEGALKDWARSVDENLRQAPSQAQAAQGMLNWLASYQVKGSWDDRTLVVITQLETNDGSSESDAERPEPAKPTDDR